MPAVMRSRYERSTTNGRPDQSGDLELVDLRRRRKTLATGKIRTHEKRDGEYVDTTRDSITNIDQQIAELDRILQDYRRRG